MRDLHVLALYVVSPLAPPGKAQPVFVDTKHHMECRFPENQELFLGLSWGTTRNVGYPRFTALRARCLMETTVGNSYLASAFHGPYVLRSFKHAASTAPSVVDGHTFGCVTVQADISMVHHKEQSMTCGSASTSASLATQFHDATVAVHWANMFLSLLHHLFDGGTLSLSTSSHHLLKIQPSAFIKSTTCDWITRGAIFSLDKEVWV
jgi:hypothetical protein